MIFNFNKFSIKDRRKSKWKNNGFRTIFESIIPNEVILALKDWSNNYNSDNYVLIGGYALSYYTKPRYTEDIDLIFISYDEIPKMVFGFRRNRAHAFEHIKTGVEVELLTPNHINKNESFFRTIFNVSIESDGMRVASPESLIALKLGRFSNDDKDDIIKLYKYCIENKIDIDLSKYNLSEGEMNRFNNLISDLDESISENLYMLENKLNIELGRYKKYTLNEYEVYIMCEDYGEPRFHFTKNINNKVKRFEDFQFSISLTKTFNEDGSFRILDSSTEYNSMSNFTNLDKLLKEWLSSNISYLKNDWNELNSSRKIKNFS